MNTFSNFAEIITSEASHYICRCTLMPLCGAGCTSDSYFRPVAVATAASGFSAGCHGDSRLCRPAAVVTARYLAPTSPRLIMRRRRTLELFWTTAPNETALDPSSMSIPWHDPVRTKRG